MTNYIFENVRKRIDIGLMWIFKNYLNLKQAQQKKKVIDKLSGRRDEADFSSGLYEMEDDEIVELKSDSDRRLDELRLRDREEECLKEIKKYELDYDRTLYTILFNLQQRQDPRDFLFSKVICQVPILTENCLKLLKTFCQDERRFYFSMNTLRDLIVSRFTQRPILLNLLLELTHDKNIEIRSNAISICRKLHERNEFRIIVEVIHLNSNYFLKLNQK